MSDLPLATLEADPLLLKNAPQPVPIAYKFLLSQRHSFHIHHILRSKPAPQNDPNHNQSPNDESLLRIAHPTPLRHPTRTEPVPGRPPPTSGRRSSVSRPGRRARAPPPAGHADRRRSVADRARSDREKRGRAAGERGDKGAGGGSHRACVVDQDEDHEENGVKTYL